MTVSQQTIPRPAEAKYIGTTLDKIKDVLVP